MTALLSIQHLTKSYPGVVANNDVTFALEPGEIHALLGENGAGKSTLVKAIYGLVRPDSGHMEFRGKPYAPANPKQARAQGIAMVFQHFSLFEAMTVAENIALGMESPPPRHLLAREIRDVSRDYGLPLDPNRLVGDLSAGQRQRVEIVRCLLQRPKLLIMDEPTSVLTPQEVETLFATLEKLAAEGVAILYISHKLEEIRTLCSHATILRGGKVVDTCIPRNKTAHELAEMMIGQELAPATAGDFTPGDPMLKLMGLTMPSDDPFGTSLKDISLILRKGEVMGIAGVAGNGQDELMLAISGERLIETDQIVFDGLHIGHYPPAKRRLMGLLTAPEERLGHAAAPNMSLTENGLLTGRQRQRLVWKGFIKPQASTNFARAIVKSFDVRTPGVEAEARSLSGGNLQKFVIGREILQRPKALVVNQPTWGVDAHAAATIRKALRKLAEDGAAVLVISQDLDELMEIADTFAVLEGGRLSVPRPTKEMTVEQIGIMMAGGFGEKEAANAGA